MRRRGCVMMLLCKDKGQSHFKENSSYLYFLHNEGLLHIDLPLQNQRLPEGQNIP